SHAALQIVLIGDFQAGSQLDALQTSEWPEAVRLDVHRVEPADVSNARVRLVQPQAEDFEGAAAQSVRVRNVAGSAVEQFEVVWSDGAEDRSRPVSFYV